MTIKRVILRLFFTTEVLLFSWVYLYGTHGLSNLLQLQQESLLLAQEVEVQRQSINSTEKEIELWNSHPFYKEKIARGLLQMAGRNEEVYVVL